MADGLPALREALSSSAKKTYKKHHWTLAEGSFILAASEGDLKGIHSSFYDLFRIAKGKIVEHWDTVDAIPPRSEWKNENGKF
jgi:predicted SnoaL-like aldol condensation-catalyzing enzyme